MKPNVAIIAGGNSSEIVVSVKSGENIFKAIDQGFISTLARSHGRQ